MVLEDVSENQTRPDFRKSNVLALVLFIVGIITPYGFSFTPPNWVILSPVVWIYGPTIVFNPGTYVLYSLIYGIPGYIQFVLFLYTIVGRLCYPFQLRRYFHGKSTISTTMIIGLMIDLPIILSAVLVFPVYPLPISTLIAFVLIKYFGTRNRVE
ncbi:MAG: hypothetical protein ACW97G_00015 [Candidatus Thorarchaeota archaeon]